MVFSRLWLVGLLLVAGDGLAWAELVVAMPPELQFPDTGVGTQSPPQVVTFTNTSPAVLAFDAPALAGPGADCFSFDNPGRFMLEPARSIGVPVACRPSSIGDCSASLVLRGSGLDPVTVGLSCVAREQVIEVYTGNTLPHLLDFDLHGIPTFVYTESDPMSVAIKVPTGGVPVIIAEIASTDPRSFRINTSSTLLELAPGAETELQVFFMPVTVGTTMSAEVRILLAGHTQPSAVVTVKGTGQEHVFVGRFVQEKSCTIGGDRSHGGSLVPPLGMVGAAFALFLRRRRRE